MKKIFALMLATIMLLSVVGCGKKEEVVDESSGGVSTAEEIVRFVNQDLPSISADRDSAVAIYNEYFTNGADSDSTTWRNRLENEALVTYDTYLNNLQAFGYESAEVNNLRDLFVKSSQGQRDAIQHVSNAIGNVDTEELTAAQQAIDDSETYLKMYQDELKRLCEAYNITMIGEFTTSTMTDASPADASPADPE